MTPRPDWLRGEDEPQPKQQKRNEKRGNEVKPWSERTPEERRAWVDYLQGKGAKPGGAK